MKTILIPAWAVKLAIRYHGKVYAYHGGIEFHPYPVLGTRICSAASCGETK